MKNRRTQNLKATTGSRRLTTSICLLVVSLLILASCSGPKSETVDYSYRDTSLPIEQRVEILINQMTIDEKIGQMTQVERGFLSPQSDISYYGLGSILSGGGSTPQPNTVSAWAQMVNSMQDEAEKTRLGIPLLYGTDAVHGHGNLLNAVIYPHHIGLGAANDPELVYKIARATAMDIVATGARWNFAPCLAVPMDIRWGRTYEGYSSDPQIVSRLGAAEVRGYQEGWGSSSTVLATAKHFVADGGTQNGTDRGDARISSEEVTSTHLLPYYASLDEGVGSVMASFSSINGQPMHSNSELLTDLLKNKLNFSGFVVSDWEALDLLPGTGRQQVEQAINAGIDMVMVPEKYKAFIGNLRWNIEEGTISQARIDDAVSRILRVKFEMGLFEHNRAVEPKINMESENRQLARDAVAASLVLLQNGGSLPLDRKSALFVYGEFADDIGVQSGGWTLTWQGKAGSANKGTSILEALGNYSNSDAVQHITSSENIPTSASLGSAPVAVLVTGETPYAEMMGDKMRPAVPAEDIVAAKLLMEAGYRVVSILISGRPLLLDGLQQYSDAIVAAWLPGSEAAGIADVLFGDKNFSGTLPFYWPADERGFVQNLESAADNAYLFARGYGLSY